MKKWIKNHTFLSVVIISLVIVICYFLIGVWYMDSEPQDVSIYTNVSDGVVIIDDLRVSVGEVCLPKIKQGEHVIKVEKDRNTIISQKVDIGDVGWKVLEEDKSDENVKLEVKLDNCNNWNR